MTTFIETKSKYLKDRLVGWHKYQARDYPCPVCGKTGKLTLIGRLPDIKAGAAQQSYACDKCNDTY